ncbi:MAG: glycosyltransferase family 39 protein [Anaerolineales bacterium]
MLLRQRRVTLFHNNTAPILLLLLINLVIGLLTFHDYGFSLDEPLYYNYAESIGYAYSPAAWFSGDFDLTRAYGASPADHANRGPAYLLLTRLPAQALQTLGLDKASAWHLINFLAFQIGLYFFYRFCLRWMQPLAAFAATAFMSSQPILWEHAFINPKDPPFLVFFLVTLELGFRMSERLANPHPGESRWQTLRVVLLPAVLLGLTTNLRVLGPLAAALAGLYFITLKKPQRILWFIPYGLIAYLVMVITWPYLWENPIGKFIQVVRFMSYNPTTLRVYFYGNMYQANTLPLRYLPAMMLFTLSEPVWPLAGLGLAVAAARIARKTLDWKTLLPALGWFLIPFTYVLLRRPPMYDGFRHFLFIVPPLFVLAGLALQAAFQWVQRAWLQGVLFLAILLPGILPAIALHPYEYTYYNQFVGGTGQAAYRFETDYWLTCYKEAVAQLEPFAGQGVNLYVQREFYIAAYYTPPTITVLDGNQARKAIQPGDYLLMNSRANPSLQRFRDPNQIVLRVGRDGALFCVIQRQ